MECSVCTEEIKDFGSITKCDHVFHYGCIRRWWKHEKDTLKRDYHACPYCAQNIDDYQNIRLFRDEVELEQSRERTRLAEDELIEVRKKSAQSEARILELEGINAKLSTQQNSLASELALTKEQLQNSYTERNELVKRSHEMDTTLANRDKEKTETFDMLTATKKKLTDVESEFKNYRSQIEVQQNHYETKIQGLEFQLAASQAELLECKKSNSEVQQKMESLVAQLDSQSKCNEGLQHHIDSVTVEAKHFRNEFEDCKQKLTALEEEHSLLLSTVSASETNKSTIEKRLALETFVKTELDELRLKTQRQEDEILNLKKTKIFDERRCSNLFLEAKTALDEVSKLEKRNSEIQLEKLVAEQLVSDGKKTIDLLRNEVKDLKNMHHVDSAPLPSLAPVLNPTIEEQNDKSTTENQVTVPKRPITQQSAPVSSPPKSTKLRMFACEVCKKTFNSLSTKIQHKDKHDFPDGFKCKICGVKFIYRTSLRKHEKLKHPE